MIIICILYMDRKSYSICNHIKHIPEITILVTEEQLKQFHWGNLDYCRLFFNTKYVKTNL